MRKAVRYEGKILPGGNAGEDESDDLEEPPSDHECSNEEVDADGSGRGSSGNLNRLEVQEQANSDRGGSGDNLECSDAEEGEDENKRTELKAQS